METLAGTLLIAAFVLVTPGAVINVPGLYATRDTDEQMLLIAAYRTRWLINQLLVVVFLALTGAGFIALAIYLADSGPWLPAAAAVAVTAGTVSGVYFLYLQTTRPRAAYGGAYPIPEVAAYWLWLAGLLLYGLALLQGGAPAWLGYLTAGASLVYAVFYLLTRIGYLTPFVVAILELVIGIVLLTK